MVAFHPPSPLQHRFAVVETEHLGIAPGGDCQQSAGTEIAMPGRLWMSHDISAEAPDGAPAETHLLSRGW